MSQLWVLKTKGEKASFGGNTGYDDNPSSYYIYDTTVKNHDKVNIGDYVIITNKQNIIGVAQVESIKIKKGISKTRYSCPICDTTEFYRRKGINPPYRCRKKHEFEKRIEKKIFVDNYTASYQNSFLESKPVIGVEVLSNYYIKRNVYYSIQAADIRFLTDKFPDIIGRLENKNLSKVRLWGKKDVSNIPFYTPKYSDERDSALKKTISRKGQTKFKNNLIDIYSPVCMISDVFIPITIQASHIWPYRGEKDNNPRNGLLLRADLHILYDEDLIGINPNDLSIHLHPEIQGSYYKKFKGKKIKIKRKNFSPSKEALELRWIRFQSKIKK